MDIELFVAQVRIVWKKADRASEWKNISGAVTEENAREEIGVFQCRQSINPFMGDNTWEYRVVKIVVGGEIVS